MANNCTKCGATMVSRYPGNDPETGAARGVCPKGCVKRCPICKERDMATPLDDCCDACMEEHGNDPIDCQECGNTHGFMAMCPGDSEVIPYGVRDRLAATLRAHDGITLDNEPERQRLLDALVKAVFGPFGEEE